MQGIMSFQIIRRNNKACIILKYVIHQIEVQFAGDYLLAALAFHRKLRRTVLRTGARHR